MTKTELPTGDVTFLFTDIEGSTRLLREVGDDGYGPILSEHNRIIRDAIGSHGGTEIRTEGDAFFVVFDSVPNALAAARESQVGLQSYEWPSGKEVRVRMGIHNGVAKLGGDNYLGIDVHRAARIADAAHGGQVLLSREAANAVREHVIRIGEFRLKDIGIEELFQLSDNRLQAEFPPPRSLGPAASQIPTQLTTFVGRADLLTEIDRLFGTERLITLTGPGGTGKTRLATRAAEASQRRFRDGACYVPLSGISDPDLLAVTILKSLGLQTSSTVVRPDDHLVSFLTEKDLLLVLDNFEHLIGSEGLIARILDETPGVRVLVTSRVPLRLGGEREVAVPPLLVGPTPQGGLSEGARLFIDRAQSVKPGFAPGPAEVEAIEDLALTLDGLPLAIELAASRVNVLAPEQILDRLDNQLLTSRAGSLPRRQRTINAAIAWSYELLHGPAQRLFERMSVFAGGGTLEEIDRVCRDPTESDIDLLDNLGELIDHNLIAEGVSAGMSRFSMLHVIREFAHQKLEKGSDHEEYKSRHARVFADLVRSAQPEMLTGARIRWLDRLSVEHDNIRAALDWAVAAGDANAALTLAAGMWRYWQTKGPLPEAMERVMEALAIEGGDPILRAQALEAAGGIAYWRGDLESMADPYEEAVEIVREHGDQAELALALYNQSFGLIATGEYEHAAEVLKESLSLAQKINDPYAVARVHWGRFNLDWYREDFDSAAAQARLALAGFQVLDAPVDTGWSHFALGDSLSRLGELEEARSHLEQGVNTFVEAGDLPALTLFIGDFVSLEALEGHHDRAARLAGALRSMREKTGMSLFEASLWEEPYREVRELIAGIGTVDGQEYRVGLGMSPEEAVEYALAGS